MKTTFQTITKDNKTSFQMFCDNDLIEQIQVNDWHETEANKKELFNLIKGNVYFAEKIGQRVKIRRINDSGKCIIFCKDGKYRQAYIGDLKKVY